MNESDATAPPRQLVSVPNPDPNNWSTRRINGVIAALPNMQRYLEIGLESGRTLENVHAPQRVGVDPNPLFDTEKVPGGVQIHVTTSDAFFSTLPRRTAFDIVFVDGLHTYQQTYRDVVNAFRNCPRGALLIDDVVPSDWISAIPDQVASLAERHRHGIDNIDWHGDVFKVISILADHHPELEWVTVTDRGNPQTFVWRRPTRRGLGRIRSMSPETIDSYRGLSYEDVFGSGIPESFRPCEEDDALPRVVAGLSALEGRRRPLFSRP